MTNHSSCVSNNFSVYRVSFCLNGCNLYYPMNQIRSMMSLTMLGLTPVPLVRALFLFVMMNPLVVLTTLLVMSVAWGLEFLS